MPISLSGSLNLSGSLTTTGTITATTLVVQTITSSISSITGSTNFGSLAANTHTFTGSMYVTGAFYVTTGSVGIGTSSPANTLDVQTSSGVGSSTASGLARFITAGTTIAVSIGQSSSARKLDIYSYGINVTSEQFELTTVSAQPIIFNTNSTERMRITSAGDICLTATASKNPDGYDTNRTFLTVQAKTGGSDRGAFMTLVGTAGGSPNYWLGRYAFAATTSTYNHAAITSLTDSGGAYSGCLSFTTNANASTGDASEKMRITSAGVIDLPYGQIKFPATQNPSSDANTLDDYEEGTWTPVVKLGSTTNSSSTAIGVYTKIGRVVYIQCTITGITKSGSGALSINGLPFTIGASATFGDTQAILRWSDISSSGIIIPYFNAGSTYILLQNFGSSGYTGAISDSACSATYQLYGISGFYML